MQPNQAFEIDKSRARLEMSEGEVLDMARWIAHNGRLKTLQELSWSEGCELLGVMELIERERIWASMSLEELVTR